MKQSLQDRLGRAIREQAAMWSLLALPVLSCFAPEPPAFDGLRALSDVVTQVEFGPRVPGTVAHRRCGEWLAAQLRESAGDVKRQAFFHFSERGASGTDSVPDTLPMWNLIASFNTESTDRIMICAHWDSRPFSDQDPDSSFHHVPVPGGNDGGSGVAVCLELARMMAVVPPPFGIDLVLFDGEDLGEQGSLKEYLIGSRWFVQQAGNYRPQAVILLDMVGDENLSIPREAYSDSIAPGLTNLVWNTAARLGIESFVDTLGPPIIDDHLPFLYNGIPAVDIIDFDYPYWHTHDDTADKVSAASLSDVGTVMRALIYDTPVEQFKFTISTPPTIPR